MSGRFSLLGRGALTTPALAVFVVVVIAGLSYLGVAAPALLADGRTATVQRAVDSLPQLARWPSATIPGLPAFDDVSDAKTGIWGSALSTIERHRQAQPEPLRDLLGSPRITMMLDPLPTGGGPNGDLPVPINKVGLVSDPGLASRAEVVEGRLPESTDPTDGIEIALSETVAEQLEWRVGDVRRWDDMALTLTGIVSPSGRDDADWSFITGSAAPFVEVNASGDRVLVGAGFMNVDEAAALADRVREFKVTTWMPFETAALDTTTAETAAAELRLFTADPVGLRMHASSFFDQGLSFSSSLPRAIDEGVARGEAMTAVVTVAAVGPVSVALVVLALVSRLIAVRRVVTARVLRARGASTGRLVTLLGGEGAALGVLGASVGATAAAVVTGWTGAWVLLVPVVFATVPAVVLPWGALTDAEHRGRRDLGQTTAGRVAVPVLQLLILVVTAALALLIFFRGDAGGIDPLLLALPVLLGGSGSILVLRLLPLLLRLVENRGRRRRTLTGLLGPARARRDPVVRTAPVLGVVVGLGVAVFSVAFAATVSEGIVRSAELGVGSALRVDAAYIAEQGAERVASLEGVIGIAALRGDSTVEAASGARDARATVYVIDRDDLAAVQKTSAVPLPLPESLTQPDGDRVPVVVSEALLARLGIDDPKDVELEVAGRPVRVVATAPAQVPFGAAEQWVIVDAANASALGERGGGISQLYLSLAAGADPDAVGTAAVTALGGDAAFVTPARTAAVYQEDPAFALMQGALLAASVLVALLLGVAIVATLVLGAGPRARMLAILRTLGYPRRAAGRLVTWEVAPALLLALPFGLAAGIAMAWLVIPQLDLRGFVGGPEQPQVVLGGAWPLAVVAVFALVTAGSLVAATAMASRVAVANTIRADDDDRGQ